jgi:hypothetical protein
MSVAQLSKPTNSSKLPTGAIVGCVLAIVSFLAALLLLLFILRRRRKSLPRNRDLEKPPVLETPHRPTEGLHVYDPPPPPVAVIMPPRSASRTSVMSTSTYYTTREALPTSDTAPGSPILGAHETGSRTATRQDLESPAMVDVTVLSFPAIAISKVASDPIGSGRWPLVSQHDHINGVIP